MSAAPRRELQRCQILIFLCMPLDYICNCLDLLSSWYNNICCWRLKSRVWNNPKKSETCWRITIIPAAGLQEQNLYLWANKHFYDRQLCIGSFPPGAAETHTGCRAHPAILHLWIENTQFAPNGCLQFFIPGKYSEIRFVRAECRVCLCTSICKYVCTYIKILFYSILFYSLQILKCIPHLWVLYWAMSVPLWVLLQNWECVSWCWLTS